MENFSIGIGELAATLFRLAAHAASGVVAIDDSAGRRDILVLRRGAMVLADTSTAQQAANLRLARLMAESQRSHLVVSFDAATNAYPPGIRGRVMPLAGWIRSHLENQVDISQVERMTHEFAGARLMVDDGSRVGNGGSEALSALTLDECDRRMLQAMAIPRRMDQIWPLARAPRFRLLAFVHFLRAIGLLQVSGVTAERSAPHRIASSLRRSAAMVLGVTDGADPQTIRRAYHRLARAIHPDLHPSAFTADEVAHRFRELTAAYQQLQ
jgi:DnaJ-domain-containing protein 1